MSFVRIFYGKKSSFVSSHPLLGQMSVAGNFVHPYIAVTVGSQGMCGAKSQPHGPELTSTGA